MPFVVDLAVKAVFYIAKAWAGGYGATVAFLTKAASFVLLSIASSKLFMPKVPTGALSGMQVMSRSSIDYRKVVYGQAMVSGPIVYNNVSGDDNEWLWYQVALTHGRTDSFVSIWMDGEEIPVADINWTPGVGVSDGTGDGECTTAKWVGENSQAALFIYYYLGYDNQPNPGYLTTSFPSDITSNHRGRGITHVVVSMLYNENTEEIWREQGLPRAIKALIKGRLIYDPRKDSTVIIDATTSPVTYGSGTHRYNDDTTWEWSDNPALCVADYLHHIMGVDPASSIDWASIATAADDCDVVVDIGPAASPTNTQKRFTCNGALSLGESHKSNLNRLLSSFDGKLSYSAGVWKLRASTWQAPTLTITADDLAGDVQVRGSAPQSQRFNTIRGYFVDPDRQYEASEFPHVSSATYITRDAGQTISFDLELPFTNNAYMAQRIAYRLLEQGDNQVLCTLTMNEVGAKICIGDTVQITLDDFGWSGKTFRCVDWSREANGTFKATFKEDDSGDYADPLVGEYKDVNSAAITVPVRVVPAPSGLTATAILNGVRLSWTDPPSRLYDRIEIWYSYTNSLTTATLLTTVPSSPYTDVSTGSFLTRYYWIRAVRSSGGASTYEPNNSPDTGATPGVNNIGNLIYDPDFSISTWSDWTGTNGSETEYWYFSESGSATATLQSTSGVNSTPALDIYQDNTSSVTLHHTKSVPFKSQRGGFHFLVTYKTIGSADTKDHENVRAIVFDSASVGGNVINGYYSTGQTLTRSTDWRRAELIVNYDSTSVYYSNYTTESIYFRLEIGTDANQTSDSIRIDSIEVYYLGAAFQGAAKTGTVPDPVTEAGKYLKDDGTWDTPSGTGVTASGTPANNQLAVWTGASAIEGDANLTWDGSTLLLSDKTISRPVLDDYAIADTSVTPTGTTQTITYSTSQSYQVSLASTTGNITITISGGPPSGEYGEMIVKVTQHGSASRTITWAGGTFEWPGGTAPTMTATASAVDIYHFSTWNSGTTWWGSVIQDMK